MSKIDKTLEAAEKKVVDKWNSSVEYVNGKLGPRISAWFRKTEPKAAPWLGWGFVITTIAMLVFGILQHF